jgi:hypothetical protein
VEAVGKNVMQFKPGDAVCEWTIYRAAMGRMPGMCVCWKKNGAETGEQYF